MYLIQKDFILSISISIHRITLFSSGYPTCNTAYILDYVKCRTHNDYIQLQIIINVEAIANSEIPLRFT